MTGLRVEVVPVQTETDEGEIAAAIACVFAVLKLRQAESEALASSQSQQSSSQDSSYKQSADGTAGETSENWGKASRLEGTGQGQVLQALKPMPSSRSTWWSVKSGLLSIISVGIAVSILLMCGGAAQAQDFVDETDSASGSASASAAASASDSQPMPSVASLPGSSFSNSSSNPSSNPSIDAGVALPSYPVSQLLPSRSGQTMRVLITRGGRTPEIACLDGATITALDSLTPVAEIAAGSRFLLKSEGNRLAFGGSDLFSVAKTVNSGPIRQVVAMTPRIPLGGYERLAGTVNKFSLPFDAPIPDVSARRTQVSPPIKGPIKPSGYLVVPKGKDSLISISGKVYRGAMWFRPVRTAEGVAIRVVNLVDLEDYLLSVVPSEMPANWHVEALKAQSIAARSYAVANLGKNERDGYDVKDTVDDQVYLGVESETPNGNRACDETSSVVLRHNQKVISAFFHSTSGGATELGEHVWGREI
ncbi:MAG: SpoIID/LytB domain-containing protein, partial [Leptolyngbya sp.]|nr:SpoIID/LytB domain-containing protein [Candidatus Melainabacteria bacterium]